ncbi:DUF2663 family protein [Ornithinibacillus contaminans]|uniref:DUF2663 family protein n=1 Tax=Ornithinibacillus contaminans TaxID=694055 RepID=UPI00064D739D|nr:DUF2663 family protein [Ornithinibacillus contaminans]
MPFETVENLSVDTIYILNEVIKKKNKKDYYESRRNLCLISSLLLLFGFFLLLTLDDIKTMVDPLTTFANILANPLYLFMIGLIAIMLLYHNYYQKKLKKEKDKFKSVRIEAIDYLNDSRNMNTQDQAVMIKKIMKEKHKINLYVKNS